MKEWNEIGVFIFYKITWFQIILQNHSNPNSKVLDTVNEWPGTAGWERAWRCRGDYEATSVAAAAAKSLQSCLTLCDPIDGSPPGSPVPRILQARILEWVAISFSNAWKWKMKVKSLSCVRLLATPWSTAHQAPLSMAFSRQEYWSGVPLPSPKRDIIHV